MSHILEICPASWAIRAIQNKHAHGQDPAHEVREMLESIPGVSHVQMDWDSVISIELSEGYSVHDIRGLDHMGIRILGILHGALGWHELVTKNQ